MNFSQFILILWARKKVLLWTLGITFLTTLVVSLLLPKTYSAVVSIVVDYKAADAMNGMMLPAQMVPGYMATQVDIIGSHSVALKVVEHLKLFEMPELREKFQSATDGKDAINDWLADMLLEHLDIKPSRESSVINVEYSGPDPGLVARIANAFADAYIQAALSLKVDPARRQSAWFDEQIRKLREDVENAQQKLSEVQKKKGILAADERLDVENARLTELSSKLVIAESQAYDSLSRLKQITEANDNARLLELPEVFANPLLQNIKADLARAEGKLAETGKRYGRNHPQHQSALAEVESLRNRMSVETNTAKGSIAQAAEMAQQQETELRRALEEQKSRVMDLKQNRDELAILMREVENAQHAFDATTQRASQVRLESQNDQSNIAVLNPAIPPLKPSKPKVRLNLILAVFLGTMLGTGVAFLMELLDRRVRTKDDLVEGLELLLLAELPDWKNEESVRPWTQRMIGRLFIKRMA